MIKGQTLALLVLGVLVTASPALAQHDSYATDGAKSSDYSTTGAKSSELGHLSELQPFRAAGIDATLWAWLTGAHASEGSPSYSWGAEIELDLRKTIAKRVTFGADVEFIDYDDLKRGNLEQLFLRIKLTADSDFALTLGKFNSPWGIEGRDFWDRQTGTPTLLFRAQPQDLRGAMLDAPLGQTHVTVRPFVVSGFNDEDSIPGRPSTGLMVEYAPNEKWNFGVTGWWGPGLKNSQQQAAGGTSGGGYYYGGYYYPYPPTPGGTSNVSYANSVFGLTNTWENPDYNSAHDGALYFLDAQISWKPRKNLTLSAEYVLASSDGDDDSQFWDGVAVIGSYEIDRHWVAFAHWSYLNDRDGVVTGITQNAQAIGLGAGYRITRYIELRAEYRHDFSDKTDDVDSVSVHASIGY